MRHMREAKWTEMPFESLEEVATFAQELADIMNEAIPEPSKVVTTRVDYGHGRTDLLPPEELREAAQEGAIAPLGEAKTVFLMANVSKDADMLERMKAITMEEIGASLYMSIDGEGVSATLDVEGRKLTAVEGILGAARTAIDRYVETTKVERERLERVRKQRAEAKQEDRLPQPTAIVSRPSEPGWRKILYDPWVIGIGGAVMAALIAALILSV